MRQTAHGPPDGVAVQRHAISLGRGRPGATVMAERGRATRRNSAARLAELVCNLFATLNVHSSTPVYHTLKLGCAAASWSSSSRSRMSSGDTLAYSSDSCRRMLPIGWGRNEYWCEA